MKYMLLIYGSENSYTPEEFTQCTVDSSAICHELAAQGKFITAAPLQPVATAKSVRIRDGRRLVTDGPFAETTEQLGGYYLIDVADLDEAIAIASRIPPVKKGTVEIRPVMEIDGLPPSHLSDADAAGSQGTRYMLLCYDDEQYWTAAGPAAHNVAITEAIALTHQMAARGEYLGASPLHPTSTATSIRIRDGKRTIVDGPFAETREVVGGFYVLVLKDIDRAVEIAAAHPGSRVGGIEIRPIYILPAIPIPEPSEIMNSRDLPFEREEIFKAFVNPERLARWWGPNGFHSTFQQFEFRPGGAWRHVMHGPDGKNYDNESVFASIVAPERVVVDHISAPKFCLTITLMELPNSKTRLVWRQKFESVAMRNEIAKFAVDCNEQNLDRLTAEVQSAK